MTSCGLLGQNELMQIKTKPHCYRPPLWASIPNLTVIPIFIEMGNFLPDATEKRTLTPILSVSCSAPKGPPFLQEGSFRLIPGAVQAFSDSTPPLRCPGSSFMPMIPFTDIAFSYLAVPHLTPAVSRFTCAAHPAHPFRRCSLLTVSVLDTVFMGSSKQHPNLRKGTAQAMNRLMTTWQTIPRAGTECWRIFPCKFLCRGGKRKQTSDQRKRKAATAQLSYLSSQFVASLG